MAQDFGDDIGEMLVRAIGRAAGRAAYYYFDQHVKDWYTQKYENEGMDSRDAALKAEAVAFREQVCIPFGDGNNAAYFAQVCRENGIYAAALTDKEGGGYIQFAKNDLKQVKSCAPQFSEVMTSLKNRTIIERLESSQPVSEEIFLGLTPIEQLPDLPSTAVMEQAKALAKEAPIETAPEHLAHITHDLANDPYNHTALIRDKVLSAREQCRDLEDFKAILAENGIGTRLNDDGELQFYEGHRVENGEMLEFDKSMDWPVNAKTLAGGKYQCDATLDWFEKNTPKEPSGVLDPHHDIGSMTMDAQEPQVTDGSLDMNGSTPDINQGIESHDGMDTMVNTLRIEREQNGTEVAPSMVREQSDRSREGYNLKSKADENRAASKQLSQTNDSPDRDISDKFQQER